MAFKHDKLETGNLTPRSNTTVINRRYVGGFGQPKGFSTILEVRVNESGDLHLRILSQQDNSVESLGMTLTNEQRLDLGKQLIRHNPIKWETIKSDMPKADRIVTR